MKTVIADACIDEVPLQCRPLLAVGARAVKSGVKAGDLRKLRVAPTHCGHGIEVGRQVQGSQGPQLIELRQEFVVDQGVAPASAAVDEAVTGGGEEPAGLARDPVEDGLDCLPLVAGRPAQPGVGRGGPGAQGGGRPLAAEIGEMPSRQRPQARLGAEDREFEARRTCVESDENLQGRLAPFRGFFFRALDQTFPFQGTTSVSIWRIVRSKR